MRVPGSGLYRDVAVAAEELWAAALVGSRARMFDWAAEIDHLYATGHSGLKGSVIRDWFSELAMGLGLSVRCARREHPDVLGDASAELADGTRIWFELKTQTLKAAFVEMTQADWVRDATTGTSWLCDNERAVAGSVSAAALRELRSPVVPAGWTFEDAWLGDLLLLTDEAKRRATGAVDRTGLARFAELKYFVHTTREGARVIRMADLSPVAAILGGSSAPPGRPPWCRRRRRRLGHGGPPSAPRRHSFPLQHGVQGRSRTPQAPWRSPRSGSVDRVRANGTRDRCVTGCTRSPSFCSATAPARTGDRPRGPGDRLGSGIVCRSVHSRAGPAGAPQVERDRANQERACGGDRRRGDGRVQRRSRRDLRNCATGYRTLEFGKAEQCSFLPRAPEPMDVRRNRATTSIRTEGGLLPVGGHAIR